MHRMENFKIKLKKRQSSLLFPRMHKQGDKGSFHSHKLELEARIPVRTYNRPSHLSHSVGCMEPNLQGLMWFACRELCKEELLSRFMSS